jgi:membrane protein implicated in regulation of membrane protease activity
MNLTDFFAACLLFGLLLSTLSFFGGARHLHFHGHGHSGGESPFNFGTIAAFIMWFGGAGSILVRFHGVDLLLIFAGAVAGGLAGAWIIYLFLSRVLARGDKPLDPADYRMIGALGKVSGRVAARGTGEMIFVQQGRRVGVPIRSENGKTIESGTEVVVTRYEDGIAYVRTWDEFSA